MKHDLRTLSTACCIVALLPAIPASGQNLVTNPGFESGTTGWLGFGATLSTQTSQVHSGSGAVLAENRAGTWSGVRQNLDSVLEDGTSYRISAWVRLAGPGNPVADFDAGTQVSNNSPSQNGDFALDTISPVVTSSTLAGYTGADVYGAMNERNKGLWTVATSSASGLRVRMNNSTGNGVDGLFLFRTDAVNFDAANDTLDAPDIFTSQIQRLSSAIVRFVVEDAGQFYISEPSPNFSTGGSGNQVDAFTLDALDADWFNYDPVSAAADVSVIGSPVTPAFTDIDFIGFALFADGVASGGGGVNFGVRAFSADAVPFLDPVRLTMKKTDGSGTNFTAVAIGTATSAEWTQLLGGYDLNVSGPLTELFLYLEGPDTGVNYYADDFFVEYDWRPDANARIEEIRKRDVLVNLVDPAGNPVHGVGIDVTQTRHRFGFGSAINHNVTNSQYAAFFADNFEWAVMENESKWYANEPTQGNVTYVVADSITNFCYRNNITMRGHTVFWAVSNRVQAWVQALSDPDLLDAVSNRLDSAVTHFRDTFVHWDVNNEMLHGTFFADRLGDGIRPWMFAQARALDPDVALFVNDYSVVSGNQTDDYKVQIADLMASNAPLDGIGAQGHFGATVNPTLTEARIDSLAEMGLPIWITEYDSLNADEFARADNLETLYRMAFSKSSVNGVLMWGFWAGSHWKGPDAAIVDLDWTVNEAGLRYQSLLAEWTTITGGTSDVSGEYAFRGFHGSYDVVLTPPGGLPTLRRLTLDPGAGTNGVTFIVHLTGEAALLHDPQHTAAPDRFSFRLTGDAGHDYEIKSATSLEPQNWSPVTNVYNPEGTISVTNDGPGAAPVLHFRAEKIIP